MKVRSITALPSGKGLKTRLTPDQTRELAMKLFEMHAKLGDVDFRVSPKTGQIRLSLPPKRVGAQAKTALQYLKVHRGLGKKGDEN